MYIILNPPLLLRCVVKRNDAVNLIIGAGRVKKDMIKRRERQDFPSPFSLAGGKIYKYGNDIRRKLFRFPFKEEGLILTDFLKHFWSNSNRGTCTIFNTNDKVHILTFFLSTTQKKACIHLSSSILALSHREPTAFFIISNS